MAKFIKLNSQIPKFVKFIKVLISRKLCKTDTSLQWTIKVLSK